MPKWKKLGQVFCPNNNNSWMISHAGFPTPLFLDDRIRVYFACRDNNNKSTVGFADLDCEQPLKVLRISEQQCIGLGKLGTFDDCGVQPMQAIQSGDDILLYYLGWNPGVNILARNNTGLARSVDNGVTFERVFEGPILDRNKDEPYFAYTPFIIRENGIWRMWYASGTGWKLINGQAEGLFEIKYAESKDGIDWLRPNVTVVGPKRENEVLCRPSVLKSDGNYHMWYSHRSIEDFRGGQGSYKIGYAISKDGSHWERNDSESGIELSDSGWDSEMICFSSVVQVRDKVFKFYSGNGFGKTGFGVAELMSL